MNGLKSEVQKNTSWFKKLGIIVLLILVWGVASEYFEENNPSFKYDFFNSSTGLMVKIEPMHGKQFPEGDVIVSIIGERRPGGGLQLRRFFNNVSYETMSPKDDFKFGGYWLKSPLASHVSVKVEGMGIYNEVKVPTFEGLQWVPWEPRAENLRLDGGGGKSTF